MVTDMNAAQSKIYELGTLLEKLYSTARSPHPGNLAETHEVNKTIPFIARLSYNHQHWILS